MHKSKKRWRGRSRRTGVGKQKEEERTEKRTNAWKSDWSIRGTGEE